MPEDIVIAAEHLSKAYRIWKEPVERLLSPLYNETSRFMPNPLSAALKRRSQAGYKDFFALNDVSFEVNRGEAVGIVGRNGSGKSTLLQLIAGTLQPTGGSIKVTGRVAALLELGAGFNPDFTGRENIFLSGAILGLAHAEVARRFDEIAAFADIGDFVEQSVKTYSSGMMMRLAFAVNTCVDPDILIVDEALSVGDAPFQAKCFRRLRQLIDNGVSLLFVSHDIGTVRSICSRALWLKTGRAAAWGKAKQVAREYEMFCWQEQGIPFGQSVPVSAPAENKADNNKLELPAINDWLKQPTPEFLLHAAAGRIGTGAIQVVNCILCLPDGGPVQRVAFDAEATWHVLLKAHSDLNTDIVIGLAIFDVKGNRIAGVQNVQENLRLEVRKGAEIHARITMKFPFMAEKYTARITVLGYQDGKRLHQGVYDFNRSIIFDQISDAIFFEVDYHAIFPIAPPVCLPAIIKLDVAS